MTTTPRIALVVKGVKLNFKKLIPRSFHESIFTANKHDQAVVRQKSNKETLHKIDGLNNKNYICEDTLPPLHLLRVAHDSGALSVKPEKALQFLRQYYNLTSRPCGGLEQKLCTEFGIEPGTVALLAAILRRCKTKAQKSLARALMLSASALGDKPATFEIISSALRSNVIQHYQGTLNRLHKIAQDGDQKAMLLFGRVLFYNNSETKSLSWLQKATQPPTGNLEFDGAGEALVLKGRILKKLGDSNGAKAAFEKAAKVLNEPEAYFYLSQMEEDGSSNQEVYLLRAATTGIIEAWYNMGVLELGKIQKRSPQPKRLEEYYMAREWFLVAAHSGNGPSMLNLAIICKITQNLSQAFSWLDKAELDPSTSEEAIRFKNEWSLSSKIQA